MVTQFLVFGTYCCAHYGITGYNAKGFRSILAITFFPHPSRTKYIMQNQRQSVEKITNIQIKKIQKRSTISSYKQSQQQHCNSTPVSLNCRRAPEPVLLKADSVCKASGAGRSEVHLTYKTDKLSYP